jgi:hypothetical protein
MTNTPRERGRSAPNRARRWPSSGSSSDARPKTTDPQNARRNYERYLALAQAQVQAGDTIGAENFYQYAEHYFRTMSADRDAT